MRTGKRSKTVRVTKLNLTVLRDLKARMGDGVAVESRFDSADMPHARRLLAAELIQIVGRLVIITEAGHSALAS